MIATRQEIKAALTGIQAVAEAIRNLKQVPSTDLYIHLMGHMDIQTYESIIGLLKRAGLVKEKGSLLKWALPMTPEQLAEDAREHAEDREYLNSLRVGREAA